MQKRNLMAWVLHSLRGRLMLLMLAAALPAFLILLYAAFWLRQEAIARSETHLLNQAQSLAAQQQARVDETERLLATLAALPVLPDRRRPGCDLLLGDVQRGIPQYVANLVVVRPDGWILCAARGNSRPTRIADRPYFQRALQATGFAGGDYIVGRLTDEPLVVFTHTLRQEGAPHLILVAALDLSWLHGQARFREFPAGAAYALYDNDGTLLLRHPESTAAHEAGQEHAGTPFWRTLAGLPGSATFRASETDGPERLFGYAPLGPAAAPYGRLVVSQPVATAHAEANQLLRLGFLALALACALGLVVGWTGGRALVLRPLRPIFATVRRVADGDLDARTGTCPQQGNEIGQLAGEVDRMAATLAAENQERRQAEELLRREHDRMQTYLDIVGVMVVALDANGDVVLTNRKACEVLACTCQGGCMGINWFDHYVPPEHREALRGVFSRLLAGQAEPAEYHENEVLTHAGERRLIAWHNAPLRGENGCIIGTLSAGEDITERRRSEEALRTTQQMLKLVTDTIPYHVFWKDRHSAYLGCNAVFARDAGLADGGEIAGKSDYDLTWHEQAGLYRQDDAQVMATGQAKLNYIEPQTCADGQLIWLETSKVPLRNGAGQVIGVLGLYRDITQRRQMEEERERLQAQLQQARKMEALGQLTGGIAHDFNNILASVLGFTKLALQRHVEDKDGPLAEYLREVITAGERARDLVAKMLTFSRARPEGEAPSLSPRPLVREALRMLASTIPASIRIDSHFEADIPDVAIAPVDLHQILMNLVINARDAMDGKGRIDVRLARRQFSRGRCNTCHDEFSGDYVVLSVTDTGHGIPADVLPRIFDPFFTTKEVGKGTGMGLAVVHGLVLHARGHLQVESRVGQGTQFQVLLPLAATASVPPAPATREAPPALPVARGQVMVIDDEAALRRLLVAALTAGGWSVEAFAEPQAALERFRQAPRAWDAVVTDEAMPDMTGAELIAALHATRPDLPVILCTGYSDQVDEAAALRLGACRFFYKPVATDDLLAALAPFSQSH